MLEGRVLDVLDGLEEGRDLTLDVSLLLGFIAASPYSYL